MEKMSKDSEKSGKQYTRWKEDIFYAWYNINIIKMEKGLNLWIKDMQQKRLSLNTYVFNQAVMVKAVVVLYYI